MLRSSWVKACETRTPERFSWKSALTVAMCSRAWPYAWFEYFRNSSVATASGGMRSSTGSIRRQLMIVRATSTPKKLMRLTSALTRPLCRSCDWASTSVVMRVMTRPAISRS